jgi:protein-tyrosine phosphatase
VIDLHCHILPGIDDGPPTTEESVELARVAVASGIATTVATPHVTWDHQHNTAASIAEGVEALRTALREADVPLEVRPGAEIAMTRVGDLAQDELEGLRLGGGSHLLVECPLSAVGVPFGPIVGALRAAGHQVLLAHPERCPAFQRDPEAYAALVEDPGVLGQITSGAIAGRFGPPARDLGLRLLREGRAHVVSTDAHSAGKRRPSLAPELDEVGLGSLTGWLCEEVPAAVLAGAPLPPSPPRPEPPRGGLLGRLRRGERR